jgi:sugar phosphate isomerase/epimerase
MTSFIAFAAAFLLNTPAAATSVLAWLSIPLFSIAIPAFLLVEPNMPRPVTLFTGQWADLPLSSVATSAAEMGYDGLELACWGDHFDVRKALAATSYCREVHARLADASLRCWAISNHLVGQAVCDPIDIRHKAILPKHVWGKGDAEGVNKRAAAELADTARAAGKLQVAVVNGFTGSPVWHMLYAFPPTSQKMIDGGFKAFAKAFKPILNVFKREGVKFALEVHPTEIAYDLETTQRAIDAVDGHESFCFNFDPSHLLWQGIDPAAFITRFGDRITHVHMKDVAIHHSGSPAGTTSILGGHLPFGHPRRAWDFRSLGRGDVDFDAIIRGLNAINYRGPLSVEWEDPGMDRYHGAAESAAFVRSIDFLPAATAFDSAFER